MLWSNHWLFRIHLRACTGRSGGSDGQVGGVQILRPCGGEQGNLGPGDGDLQLGLGVPGQGSAPKLGGQLTG